MENQTVHEGKTIAIISYITFIGTIIAFIMNQSKQNYFASFHIRQAIGLGLLSFTVSLLKNYLNLGLAGSILGFAVLGLWLFGLIGAIQGEEKKIPLLGDQFQEWFKNIG
ncbi:MAG: hypothetical protein COC22_04505 [Flavobacteriaceae bacterium]|nr:MAG: hypothetical protein COC22_04505 [Flavobacteriaceae bacterium]